MDHVASNPHLTVADDGLPKWHRPAHRADGNWLGHGGFSGQYLFVHPATSVVVAHLGVIRNTFGFGLELAKSIIETAEEIVRIAGDA